MIIPNAAAIGSTLVNYSTNASVRLDLIDGIGYGDDIRRAKQVLLELMSEHPQVLKEPAPSVGVWELGDSSVNLVARPHVHVDDMTRVKLDLNEQVKLRFDAPKGSPFPFPREMSICFRQNERVLDLRFNHFTIDDCVLQSEIVNLKS